MDTIAIWFIDNESEEKTQESARMKRRKIRDRSNPLDMDTNLFILNFRLNKEAFLEILQKIYPELTPRVRRNSIPNITKLAIALRFFAQGSYQLGVGNETLLSCAQPTVSVVLEEILNVMERIICPEYIRFEYTKAEADEAKLHFYNHCKIPGVIGAIDGTHIKILKPLKSIQHLYYNRKGYHSINALIVCDHKMQIRYIDATHPGSSHDPHVFNLCPLKAHLDDQCRNEERNAWFLGDAGYALQPYRMTPYRNAEESIEIRFNTYHAKGRNIVERTIGVYKNRWRCVLGARALHYSPEKATRIINVCAALHNVCCKYKIHFDEEDGTGLTDAHGEEMVNAVITMPSSEAETIRNQIARSLSP